MTDRQNALSPRPRCDKPGHLSVFRLKAVAAGAALALIVTFGVTVQASGAGTAPTPAEPASSYVAAIGTANAATLPPTTLASLGTPILYAVYENTRVPAAGKGWINYRPSPPATLNIHGHTYAQGAQFTWTCDNDYNAAGYVWKIPGSKTFTAQVGEQLGAAAADVTLSFLGNGKPLPFVANGKAVTSLRVPRPSSVPVAVTATLSGITKLTVVLTQVNMENPAVENYTVDFGSAVFGH
ncbi:MAG TPA: hypothetical protein VED59_00075, partial [Acidimicrobiales bacterium]|nr:hypothetical protein [Acidimicrobiales bacterium]